MSGLSLSLHNGADGLVSTFTNTSTSTLALTFWWNRFLKVTNASGVVVEPGKGPVLPCGAGEDWLLLEPGASTSRPETMACTQPAGADGDIGWSYESLPTGRYSVVLVYRAPPWHGFTQAAPHPQAFTGVVESNAVDVDVVAKKQGFFQKLFGR